MRLPLLFALPLAFMLVACKGNRDKEVVGVWTSSKGLKITASDDKTYHDDSGPIHAEGTWAIVDGDVIFTPKTINGKPVAELKARLSQRVGILPANRRSLVEKILRDIDRPNVLSVGADGKTMTTDQAKDHNEDPWPTLTKASS